MNLNELKGKLSSPLSAHLLIQQTNISCVCLFSLEAGAKLLIQSPSRRSRLTNWSKYQCAACDVFANKFLKSCQHRKEEKLWFKFSFFFRIDAVRKATNFRSSVSKLESVKPVPSLSLSLSLSLIRSCQAKIRKFASKYTSTTNKQAFHVLISLSIFSTNLTRLATSLCGSPKEAPFHSPGPADQAIA